MGSVSSKGDRAMIDPAVMERAIIEAALDIPPKGGGNKLTEFRREVAEEIAEIEADGLVVDIPVDWTELE